METLEADVVVIGAGTAGLPAALTAVEGGAKVIVFEKRGVTGGTGNMARGIFAVESRLQRKKNIALTKDQAFKIFMEYAHWRVNARLVKAYVDKSASTVDWMEEHGVEFLEPAAYFPGSHFTWHLIQGSVNGAKPAANMMKMLTEQAREKGVEFHLKTEVKQIDKDEHRIAGVIAEDKSGQTTRVNAKAVIIATGGFADNDEWIKKYTGFEKGRDVFILGSLQLTGDGIRMAWDVGAAEEGMNLQLMLGSRGSALSAKALFVFTQPHLWINQQGQRFIDEASAANIVFAANAIARQKSRCAYAIFDGKTKKHYEEVGLDRLSARFPHFEKAENLDSDIQNAIGKGSSDLFVADSLQELGEKIGVSPDALKETIDEYNACCAKGHDDLFAKDPRYLRPVKQSKFYASRMFPGAYGTLGGIKINEKTEVLNKEHEVIPGLYAAGNDACIIYGDSYEFYLPGGTLGFAVNSGRIAGENALTYIGK